MLLEVCFLYFTQITELLWSLLAAEILGCIISVEITHLEIAHFLRPVGNVMQLLKISLKNQCMKLNATVIWGRNAKQPNLILKNKCINIFLSPRKGVRGIIQSITAFSSKIVRTKYWTYI